jgi:serine/threonine protein kinase/Tol biopolymer transport system component
LSTSILPGARLGRYEIKSLLGGGGMGEVYLAQDTKLERQVAIKILHPELASRRDRMSRFVQEARTVSALNHPNILTIYEIDDTDAGHFIATEFIDGETLRHHLNNTRMKIGEVLEIAIQVASALSAAHAAGIVHRDIKPENIMLRRDGIVKVLDFGLAKLTEEKDLSQVDPEAETRGLVRTDPGTVLGTARYMSPEQVRGLELDARTDIWSLGVVMYEMVARGLPFVGETKSHVMVSILDQEPASLAAFAPNAPTELQRIVRKCLSKDRDSRYQTSRDLMIDLKNLRRDLDLQGEIERSIAPHAIATGELSRIVGDQTKSISRDSMSGTQAISYATATEDALAHPTSSAEYIITEIKRHKTGAFVAFGLLLLIAAGIFYAAYRFRARSPLVHFQSISIKKLTTLGTVSDVVISPDGKYVVYDVTENDRQGLWTMHLPTGSTVPIVPSAEVLSLGATTFSPDGNFVYYVLWDKSNLTGSLFRVTVLGRDIRRILENIRSPVSFSPDGKQFVFARAPDANVTELIIADADGSNQHRLASLSGSDWFSFNGASWSPDGKLIACGTGTTTGGRHMTVSVVSVADGTIKPVTSQQWSGVNRVAWFADGSGIVFLASPPITSDRQIWQVSYPGGEVRRVTNDLNRYGDASLGVTADGSTLVSLQATTVADIWVGASVDAARARQITSRSQQQNGARGMSWTKDGRVVYGSYASGNADIWIMNADGSNQKQLTDHPQADENPVVSPNGRYVVFQSLRTGNWNLWRMDIDGGNLKQLTTGENDVDPDITPDNQWVIYCSTENKNAGIWKVPIDGGAPVRIASNTQATSPSVSPDGKQLAYIEVAQQAKSSFKLIIIPLTGGDPIKTFEVPILASDRLLRWSADGRALVYLGRHTSVGEASLWRQSFDGGTPTPIADFKPDSLFSFAYSRDGKQLALSRGNLTRDAVLISDAK